MQLAPPQSTSPGTITGHRARIRGLSEWEIAGLLLLVVGVVYSFGWNAPKILDDDHTFGPKLSDPLTWKVIANSSRPAGFFSFRAVEQFWGKELWKQRVVNIGLHCLAGGLLALLVRDTLRSSTVSLFWQSRSRELGWSVAALFLLHPLQTQAVTYVCQRYESQASLLAILALYALHRGGQTDGRRGWLFVCGFATLGAMLTKEMTAGLPFLLLLYDRQFLAKSWGEIAKARWGLYLFCFASLIPMVLFLTWAMAGTGTPTVGFSIRGVSAWGFLSSQPAILLHYLRLVFWPDTLILDYGWPIETSPWRIFGLGVVIVGLLVTAFVSWWRGSALGMCGLFIFVVLGPTSSFVPIRDLAFEHRMYLALAPLTVLVVIAFHQLVERLKGMDEAQRQLLRIAVVSLVAFLLSVRTAARNRDYHDAKIHWKQSLAFNPHHGRAWINYAKCFSDEQDYPQALEYYLEGAKHDSLEPPYTQIAVTYARMKRFPQAFDYFNRAIEYAPKKRLTRFLYASALINNRKFAEAVKVLREADQLHPDLKDEKAQDIKSRLAWLLSVCPEDSIRNGREAVALVQEVQKMATKPEAKWHDLLAAAYAETGNFEKAIQEEETAIRMARQNRSRDLEKLEKQLADYAAGKPRRYVPTEEQQYVESADDDA